MATTRRNFIKSTAILGGAMLVAPTRASASSYPPKGWLPAYARLEQEGKLEERIEQAFDALEACTLCPRQCGVNRRNGEQGYCRAPKKVTVYSAQPHFGEEVSLVGEGGSGTIFFSHCNLRCVYCYAEVNRAAVLEMHRQVGDLELDDDGVASRGLLVRHLVLPDGLAGTGSVARFLADEISRDTYLNLMDQYHPCFHADAHPPLDRALTAEEYAAALAATEAAGLRRLDGRQRRLP